VSDLDAKVGCVRCIGKGDKERVVPVGKNAGDCRAVFARRPAGIAARARNGLACPSLFVNRRGVKISRVGVWKILSNYGKQRDCALR